MGRPVGVAQFEHTGVDERAEVASLQVAPIEVEDAPTPISYR